MSDIKGSWNVTLKCHFHYMILELQTTLLQMQLTAWSLILSTSLKKGVPSENAASESTKKFSLDALQKQIMSTSYSLAFCTFGLKRSEPLPFAK